MEHMTAKGLIDLAERRRVPGAMQYWNVSPETFRWLRKLKDDAQNYVYAPSLDFNVENGDIPPLLGFPVRIDHSDTWNGIDLLCELRAPTSVSNDPVEHPKHYTSHPSGIECIQITEHMGFNLGNAMKYIWRADLKHDDTTEDSRKAKWYIEREIAKRRAR